jgi:hypothetical protein
MSRRCGAHDLNANPWVLRQLLPLAEAATLRPLHSAFSPPSWQSHTAAGAVHNENRGRGWGVGSND